MSPRSGSPKRKLTRSTSTRWPISSVGTIDSLGIRNGFTRNAWMPSASPSATATIVTNSTSELCWRFFSLLLATGASGGAVLGRLIVVGGRLARLVALRLGVGHRLRLRGGLVRLRRGLAAGGLRPLRRGLAAFRLRGLLGGGRLVGQLLFARARRVVGRHRGILDEPRLDDLLRPGPAALTHPRGAPHPLAQVVELGAADVPAGGHLDALDLRRVHRERALHPDAERLLADREGLARAVALALDHDALEYLRTAACPLYDLEVHAHAIARLKRWDAAQLCALDAVDYAGYRAQKTRPGQPSRVDGQW